MVYRTTPKKVFAIVLNFNSKEHIVKCLRSLSQLSIKNFKPIIVDNNSTDGSVEMVKKQFRKIKIIQNKNNLGYAKGNNLGIKYALKNNADYIFLLNPDTTLENNAINELLYAMEANARIGIAGPKIYTKNGRIWSCGGEIDKKRYTGGLIGFGGKDHGQYDQEAEVGFISGTAMFIRRVVFEKVGLLPHDYFLYYEDVDFCLKAKQAGFKIYLIPHSIAYHDWSSAVGKKSPMKEYFMARNHFLFLEKHAPFFIKFREFLRLPKTFYEHYRKDEKFALLGIRDYFLRRFGNRDYWS